MSEAVAKIVRLERRVMWRKRLLSLQDGLALVVMISGLIAAALVVLARLRPITMPLWVVIIGPMSLSFAAVLTRWFFTRASESEAAFLIDEALRLDDRVATSRLIIERGGPRRALEEALIEDTAARVGNQRAASVVPLSTRRWYALSLVSVIGLAAALMIPTRSLPVNETLAAERADIESAGEHLEQTAAEIEQAAPLGTETATLAKEQAEVGRGFRRSTATRAEALRRLSALEERIRQRHDDLAITRADEIVSLADRRLGSALSTLSTPRRTQIEPGESQLARSADEPSGELKRGASKEQQEPVPGKRDRNADSAKTDSTNPDSTVAKEAVGDGAATEKQSDQKPSDQNPGDPKAGGEKLGDQNIGERKVNDQQATELPAGSLDALKAVPDSLAEQAAKALPKVSEELLRKAAELRANELSPADIEKLRKAAEFLSRDLTQIAQSKELQNALQEMARQIRPEQIEQVARELGNQEKLKQELEAAARLLSENQQVKEMVAGLAGQFARMQDEKRQQDNGQRRSGKPGSRDEGDRPRNQALPGTRANANRAPEKLETAADRRFAGQGRESNLKGKLRPGSGGEYLYLRSKAGVGAARAPYSSAYPQYRREAERSVQRSQVPPNLRSVVRKYFDAINPDSKR
ncbi:MAG TPA: hypothetical protein VI837_01060 [Blastocatellia bacterium]|nr:hypothetical protein [Blastocatellia bacterium]